LEKIFEYATTQFSKNRTDAHLYQLEVQRHKKNLLGIGVNYSPLAFGNKISEDFKDIELTSNVLSLSLIYGKQVFQKEKATGFVNIGLVLNRYSHKYDCKIDTIYLDFDKDKDDYLRKITVDSLSKKVNFSSVTLPVSFEYVRQLTEQAKNPIFLSFELGMFAEFTLSPRREHILSYYEQYFNFDQYDYSEFDVNLKHNFACGIFGGIGFWYALNNKSLMKFNVSYIHSFNSPLKYIENPVNNKDEDIYESLQDLRNIYFSISWVRTIGGNRKIKFNNKLNFFK